MSYKNLFDKKNYCFTMDKKYNIYALISLYVVKSPTCVSLSYIPLMSLFLLERILAWKLKFKFFSPLPFSTTYNLLKSEALPSLAFIFMLEDSDQRMHAWYGLFVLTKLESILPYLFQFLTFFFSILVQNGPLHSKILSYSYHMTLQRKNLLLLINIDCFYY